MNEESKPNYARIAAAGEGLDLEKQIQTQIGDFRKAVRLGASRWLVWLEVCGCSSFHTLSFSRLGLVVLPATKEDLQAAGAATMTFTKGDQ